jgi:ribose 5-phosphate isomerase B
VALGADHAGRELKNVILERLAAAGIFYKDFGVADNVAKADYPVIAAEVARAVQLGKCRLGVLVCGTGVGMAIAANRFLGVRAANCTSEFMAAMARAHNDANILTLGQRVVGQGLALSILDAFLCTHFEGGRHQVRVELMG